MAKDDGISDAPPGYFGAGSYEEPPILIGGTRLNGGQAMSVWVAIESYIQQMTEPNALGGDEHGRRMAMEYRKRLGEVERLMIDAMFSAGLWGSD